MYVQNIRPFTLFFPLLVCGKSSTLELILVPCLKGVEIWLYPKITINQYCTCVSILRYTCNTDLMTANRFVYTRMQIHTCCFQFK